MFHSYELLRNEIAESTIPLLVFLVEPSGWEWVCMGYMVASSPQYEWGVHKLVRGNKGISVETLEYGI
jgi:hypothetical protein